VGKGLGRPVGNLYSDQESGQAGCISDISASAERGVGDAIHRRQQRSYCVGDGLKGPAELMENFGPYAR
jgi:hypothetical protein